MNENALIVAEKLDVAIVFSENGMAKLLDEIKIKVISHIPSIESDQGRKDIASLAYKITRSRTLIDDLGKEVVSGWKKKAKVIDGHRKTARDFLDDLKNTARQPLTDWEAKQVKIKEEAERKEREKTDNRIAELAKYNYIASFMEIATLPDFDYDVLLARERERYELEQKMVADEKMARKVEAERLEVIREAQEAQAIKLANIQKEIDAKEQALKDEKERLDRLEFERVAKEQARVKAEADAKAKAEREIAEAKEKAEREIAEAKAKVEREEQERIEKEKAEAVEKIRIEALRPDQEKINLYAQAILDIPLPDVEDERSQAICLNAQKRLSEVATKIREQSEEL